MCSPRIRGNYHSSYFSLFATFGLKISVLRLLVLSLLVGALFLFMLSRDVNKTILL
jgi:hypothetical protein